MWADTLQAAERAHLVRLLVWGATSVLLGSAMLAMMAARRVSSSFIRHFAIQTGAWGAIDVLIGSFAWRTLALRDLSGAVELDRFVWLNIGLDAGYAAVGVTLATVGWKLARNRGLVGAGCAVIIQGAALLALDLVLASAIARG